MQTIAGEKRGGWLSTPICWEVSSTVVLSNFLLAFLVYLVLVLVFMMSSDFGLFTAAMLYLTRPPVAAVCTHVCTYMGLYY